MSLKQTIETEYSILCSQNNKFSLDYSVKIIKGVIKFTYNATAKTLKEYYSIRDLILTMMRNITRNYKVNKLVVKNESFKL